MRFAALAAGLAFGLAVILPVMAAAETAPCTPVSGPSVTFEPREHDFSIAFPGAPKSGFHLLTDGRERAYLDNEGDKLFMVTASSFLFGAKTDDAAYDRRLRRFAQNLDAPLTSTERVIWGGDPAWEGVFTAPQGDQILVRMVVHNKRLYQAVYQGPADQDAVAEGERFMDSFRLLDR